MYWQIVLDYWRNPPGDRMVAETIANSFAAQFRGYQKEEDRKSRPVLSWHLNPVLLRRSQVEADEVVAKLTPRRRRNPLAGVRIKR